MASIFYTENTVIPIVLKEDEKDKNPAVYHITHCNHALLSDYDDQLIDDAKKRYSPSELEDQGHIMREMAKERERTIIIKHVKKCENITLPDGKEVITGEDFYNYAPDDKLISVSKAIMCASTLTKLQKKT